MSIQKTINTLTHNWINVDEIVVQCKNIHRVSTHHAEVENILNTYNLDRRTKHGQLEVRQKNAAAAEVHKVAAFAAIREIKTKLQKHNISEDELWAFLKHRYNVESQKELDTSQWATLAAELQAAKREPELLKYLLRDIRTWLKSVAPNKDSVTPNKDSIRTRVSTQ